MSARIISNGDGTCTIEGMTIWTAGTFRGYGSPKEGDQYTPKDLKQIVNSHNQLDLGPRLYYGHPLNPMLSMLAKPKGTIDDLRVSGNKIIANVYNVPEKTAREAVKDNVRLSPDMKMNYMDPETKKSHKWVITGVAMLGAVSPGNKLIPGLGDQLQLSPDKHYVDNADRAFAAAGQRSFVLDFSGRFIAADPAVAPLLEKHERIRSIRNGSRSFAAHPGVDMNFISRIDRELGRRRR